MLTADALTLGAIAAFVVGLSKTGLPGAALVSIPLLATVFDGRLIPGATVPILLAADLFAVWWYHQHTRWDVIRALAPWIGVGYVAGIAFFVAAGTAVRSIDVAIGAIVLFIVAIQTVRLVRGTPHGHASTASAASHGSTSGFTTFVANAAGPILNSYLVGRGLDKAEMVGTSAVLYAAINLSKIPFYIALGEWTDGGRFFTADSLQFDLAVAPALVVGVYAGRALLQRLPQRMFLVLVLVLSAAGAIKLVI